MTRYFGEFEPTILFAIRRLGEDVAAPEVAAEVSRRTGRKPALGTFYVTLDRLTRKGYLASRMGDPTPQRGGKARRLYSMTPVGEEALRRSGKALPAMWRDQESLLGDA